MTIETSIPSGRQVERIPKGRSGEPGLNHSCDDKRTDRTWDRTCSTDIAFRGFVFVDWFWLITREHLVSNNLYLFQEIFIYVVFLEWMAIEEFRIFIEKRFVEVSCSQSICEILTVLNYCFQFSFDDFVLICCRRTLRNSLYLWEKKKFQWIIYPANKFFFSFSLTKIVATTRQKLRFCERAGNKGEKKKYFLKKKTPDTDNYAIRRNSLFINAWYYTTRVNSNAWFRSSWKPSSLENLTREREREKRITRILNS